MAFKLLMVFTLLLFLRPQEIYPPLASVPLAKIVALLGLFIYAVTKIKNLPQLFKIKEVKLLIALLIVIIITSPFGLWPGGSFNMLTSTFMQVFLIFFLIAGTVESLDRIKKILWIIVVCEAIVAIIAVRAYFSGQVFAENRLAGMSGLYGDPNDFAISLAMAIPFAIYLLKVNRSLLKRASLIVIIAVYSITIILTYSRTGIVAIGVIALGLLIKSRKKSGVFILLLLALVVITIAGPGRLQDRAASIFVPEKDEAGSRTARITIYLRGLSIFMENPLKGVGLGNFSIAEGAKHEGIGHWKSAHNVYIETACELGIFGFLIFVGLLFFTLKNLRHMQKLFSGIEDSRPLFQLMQILEITLWAYMFSGLFVSSPYNWMFYYLMGISVAMKLYFRNEMNSSNNNLNFGNTFRDYLRS
jgi:putative inorganic carbon (HCO3(-)) transporter